jgi:hypothetical protein
MAAQRLEHGVGTDSQYSRDVADARAIQAHTNDLRQHRCPAALITVINDELAAATSAKILLFSVGSCAILLDVPAGIPRTSQSYGLHDYSLTCPSLFYPNVSTG